MKIKKNSIKDIQEKKSEENQSNYYAMLFCSDIKNNHSINGDHSIHICIPIKPCYFANLKKVERLEYWKVSFLCRHEFIIQHDAMDYYSTG